MRNVCFWHKADMAICPDECPLFGVKPTLIDTINERVLCVDGENRATTVALGIRLPPGDNALLVDCLDLFLVGGEASRTAGFEPEARALDVGFQNPSHFARMFRKFVGTSPSHFQN